MIISLIAAIGKNRELGHKNTLLWHLSDDLKRFKALTLNHAVIMGRKTYESIGRPLPKRTNIVLARDADFTAPGCTVAHSWDEVMRLIKNEPEVFVIGGGQMYALALPYASKLYLTLVDASLEADTFFPEFNPGEWNIISSEEHPADASHPWKFTFKVYEKKNA